MIQANEFKLGNLIKPLVGSLEHIGEITSISKCFINYDLIDDNFEEYLSISHESSLSNIEPIPLTKEWLLKFGFEYRDNSMYGSAMSKNGVYIGLMYNNRFCFNAESTNNKSVYLTHLHQLQNLYFALTNEELTLKL